MEVHGVDANSRGLGVSRGSRNSLGLLGVGQGRAFDLIFLLLYILLINIGGVMTGGILPLYMVDVDFFTLMPDLPYPLAGDELNPWCPKGPPFTHGIKGIAWIIGMY